MLSNLCGCASFLCGGDDKPAADGKEKVKKVKDQQDALEDMLRNNLMTVRGRHNLIKNMPMAFAPTKFDDDDDPPSEDEEGDENMIIKGGVFAGQNFEKLRARCSETGKPFVDPQFPPCDASLAINPRDVPRGIEWKRPGEICEKPGFFVDGGSRFDVKQGELGDCWLLAAIANMTMHKKLFQQVVPHDQSFDEKYAGIFHFRFWQYGDWIDVVVDDLLPTRDGRLIYMKSQSKNEFWSALLEKAYAKMHGCYAALKGGTTSEALVDFSGGCSEQFDLNQAPKDIFDIMKKGYQRSSMLACSLEPDRRVTEAKTRSGLVRGHAYSLTKVVKATIDTGRKTGQFPLVRIRNPWGNDTEWKGAWSDGSREWQFIAEGEKEKLGLTFDEDGEFFMSQEDYLKHFDTLEICNLEPDSLDDDEIENGKLKWFEKTFHGSWISNSSAGGCRNFIATYASNPQYRVELKDSDEDDDDFATCVISLMQKGSRKKKAVKGGEGCLTIGFAIYHLNKPEETKFPLDTDFFRYNASVAKPKAFVNLREVSARFKLNPGTYVIIPSTFNPNEEGDFLLRVFSEGDCEGECVNGED